MRVVCLDVDGCLVDSRAPILRSMNAALTGMGLAPLSDEDLGRIVGPPLMDTAARILRERGGDPDDAQAFVDTYRGDYATTSIELAASYPGMPQAVQELAARYTLAVVTSKPIHFARPILEALDLAPHFAVMEGPSLAEAEPKTATLGRALATLGAPPGPDHVMVGDRAHDVEAGRAHGLTTVGVLWGFGTREELEQAGADLVVDRTSELVAGVSEQLAAT